MNKFEVWILKKIFARAVIQGAHRARIIEIFKLMRSACEQEFYEDNTVTLNSNLKEWFEDSLRKPTV